MDNIWSGTAEGEAWAASEMAGAIAAQRQRTLDRLSSIREQIVELRDRTGGDAVTNMHIENVLIQLGYLANHIEAPVKGAPDNA